MSQNDPIADMLTSMRNAQAVGKEEVAVPHSAMKTEIARILRSEGFISDYAVEGGVKKTLRLRLKYTAQREPVIRGLRRSSSGGLRQYVGAQSIPRVLQGMGVSIVSTSAGLMTGREARRRKIGGELVLAVW
jgi:small subunit ribosomal protein S8